MKGYHAAIAVAGFVVGIVLAIILMQPAKSVVVIPEGSSMPDLKRNFEPQTMVVGLNNTVVWINQDVVAHSVISNDGYVDDLGNQFDSMSEGLIIPGQSFQFTFTRPGIYEYHSEPHPWMHGKVVVIN
jgi:plastocyanin